MRTPRVTTGICLSLIAAGTLGVAAPLILPFTYQGVLRDGNVPANGTYELRFALWSAGAGGTELAALTNVVVATNGLFTTTLNGNADWFPGDAARWLQLEVRTNGSTSAYVTLAGRQPLTHAPFAIRAARASLAEEVAPGSIAGYHLQSESVTPDKLAANAVTSAAIADGTVAAADLAPAVLNSTFWKLGGNAGTTPGAQYLGTSDSQPLEFRVNGVRALRLEPGAGSPNIIGGSPLNSVVPGANGNVIAGGSQNRIENPVTTGSTIAGGINNRAERHASVVAGGTDNRALADRAVVLGGSLNLADGDMAFVGTGFSNHAGNGRDDRFRMAKHQLGRPRGPPGRVAQPDLAAGRFQSSWGRRKQPGIGALCRARRGVKEPDWEPGRVGIHRRGTREPGGQCFRSHRGRHQQ
jgi:hypothetical protein